MIKKKAIDIITNKGKDEFPIKTINKIRNIVKSLGILTVEDSWNNPLLGFYSVSVRVAGTTGTNSITNGKGISPEYALASAYAEFMERLQNQILYNIDRDFDEMTENYLGFHCFSDEKYIKINELMENIPESLWNIYKPTDWTEKDGIDYLRDISFDAPENCKGNFICVPYYNVTDNKLTYLPVTFLKYYYGSNGMCAGNTPEEAIVQGLCEVLERYVNKEILLGNVVPPTIPKEYLKKFKNQYAMIEEIEGKGDYRIIVKDCSLDKLLPTLALIFINHRSGRYFVKFGSHPLFENALERCLTEFLQGRDINSFQWLSPFKYFTAKDKLFNNKNNLYKIFTRGEGFYPNSLFSDEFDYFFNESTWNVFYSNKDMLSYLVNLIKGIWGNILIRNVSFLTFPSFHVIVPAMSEIFSYTKEEYKSIRMKRKTRKIVRNITKSEDQHLQLLANFLKNDFEYNKSLNEITGLPLKEDSPMKNIKYSLFLSSFFYRAGNVGEAHRYIEEYLKYIETIGKETDEVIQYYRCVRDYLSIISEGNTREKSYKILSLIYGENKAKEIIEDMNNPGDVFKYYKELSCWDCRKCEFKEYCHYDIIKQLHFKMKEYMKKNDINQMDLKYIL